MILKELRKFFAKEPAHPPDLPIKWFGCKFHE
jgi:hypothetical protein